MLYICFIGVLEMPKKIFLTIWGEEQGFWATPIFTIVKLIDFVSNSAGR